MSPITIKYQNVCLSRGTEVSQVIRAQEVRPKTYVGFHRRESQYHGTVPNLWRARLHRLYEEEKTMTDD